MNIFNLNKKLTLILLCMTLSCLLIGCGEDNEMTTFQKELTTFFSKVESLHIKMNDLDPQSITATVDLLNYLTEIDEQFKYLASINIPTQFSYLEPLMEEASTYMTVAVADYHEAYSNGSYDEYIAATAYENYGKACARLTYLINVLQNIEQDIE